MYWPATKKSPPSTTGTKIRESIIGHRSTPCYTGEVSESSFVVARDVSVAYASSPGILGILSGQSRETYTALNHLSFQLPLGLHAAVYGQEGSGKTTLLRLLTGALKPTRGSVRVNGQVPHTIKHIAAGYVSNEESEPTKETCYQILKAFAATHGITDSTTRIGEVSDILHFSAQLHRPADTLSTALRLKLNLARAALSDAPLILLDDVADHLGGAYTADLIAALYAGRTVLVATRRAETAEQLALPLLILHNGRLTHFGTVEEIAADLSCPRIVDVWIEGLRYDLLRRVREQSGVIEARLLPSTQFSGQRLRITLHSARHLPALYDLVSRAPLIKVVELPTPLNEILSRLP
jgi:ABC-type multidrug transport system ATPase subunit